MTQILSHLPQLYETYTRRSSEGVSLITQHLNLLGGLAGVYMYSIIPPKSLSTYLVYFTSLLQAVSLYALAVYFDGWERLLNSLPVKLMRSPATPKADSPKDDSTDLEEQKIKN